MQTQSHSFQVTPLTEQDVIWFVEVAATRMLVEELKRPELINHQHLYALVLNTLKDNTSFIVKKDNKCIGALGALIVPNLFNPSYITLAEVFWYVLPEYRNTRAGLLLLNSFDERARQLASDATLSLLPSSEVGIKSLAKKGFNMEEMGFRKSYGEK